MRHRIALTPERATTAARALQVGGVTPFTSIDYPGKLSAVVYVQGCPLRCSYCHNPHLQQRCAGTQTWGAVHAWLQRRVGLVDAVVFSGGEPTVDPMLEDAMHQVRALGFSVGLHSAGTHPRRLQSVLPLLDWIGLDVKAPLRDAATYERITGVRGSASRAEACLKAVLQAGVDCEIRTTAHPLWLGDAALLQLAQDLAKRGVRRYALQIACATEAQPAPPVADYPQPGTLARLKALFAHFVLRRA